MVYNTPKKTVLEQTGNNRMKGRSGDFPGRLLGWWVSLIQRHSLPVIIVTLLLTAGVFYYSIRNFRINVDTGGMISEKLRFRQLEIEFSKAFPQMSDTIVVVLDADAPELALSARKRMAERLRKETRLFRTVSEPGGGAFFEKNGLLYLSVKELEDFADSMAGAQPFFAMLSEDLSLRGLFSVLERALSEPEGREAMGERINLLLDRMGETFEEAAGNRARQLSWQAIMLGDEQANKLRRQFIILQPYLDSTRLSSGEAPLEAVRSAAKEMGFNGGSGVKMHITGDVALSHENLIEVRNTVGAATLISFLLVGVTLFVGLGRSGRLVFASLVTLGVGLIWTTGFAIAFVGSLNLISVTFAVLFIGLGIDYSIQFCLRYRELMGSGLAHEEGIVTTAKGVGRSLLVSCVTIAIGFYSFVPTAYAGVGELGFISGTGMLISFFANLTILPALLTLLPVKGKKGLPSTPWQRLVTLPYVRSGTVGIVALMSGLGAVMLLPGVYFDYNPLNLYDKKSEAITTIKELFKDPESVPWTASVLAGSREEANETAERLRKLKEVKMVITLSDFVAEDQTEKLKIISDVALFMPPSLKEVRVTQLSHAEELKALSGFEKALEKSLHSPDRTVSPSARRLYESIQRFKALLHDPVKGQKAFAALDAGLLSALPDLLRGLETSFQASAFGLSDLPGELTAQYLSPDGRYRVQVFPGEDIMNRDALERFVRAVRTVAPDATDSPITVLESGKAVVSSFRQATLSALVVIILYLLIELRNLSVTVLILVPLALAMFLAGAFSVLFDLPLNFANVIIVPLLLSVGVHNGIIFVLRHQTEPPPDGNMLKTSTARAVLLSTLTMIISTGSLSFSAHRGIASMGLLLTVCLGFLLICTLFLLPALLELTEKRAGIK
jgi:hopanoid biosynthesis associated RND transporter like protein HpnN